MPLPIQMNWSTTAENSLWDNWNLDTILNFILNKTTGLLFFLRLYVSLYFEDTYYGENDMS